VGLVQYGAYRLALGARAPRARRLSMATAAPNVDRLAQKLKVWLQDFF